MTKEFRITRVDTENEATKALLIWLQKETLPYDEPADVAVGMWWVAYADSHPVGFAAMRPSYQWCYTGYLSRAGVLSNYRGKGLQRKLIAAREREARRLGYIWMISDTTDNIPSSNNLIRSGYLMYSPTKPWAFDNSDYWLKNLNSGASK